MRNPDLDFLIVMERRRDELAEAAHDRLVKEALNARRANASPHQPRRIGHLRDLVMLAIAHLLSLIGGSMLNWGCQLQYRYELMAHGVTEHPTSPCI